MISLLRFYHPERGTCVGCLIEETVYDVTKNFPLIATWLKVSTRRVPQAINELNTLASQSNLRIPFTDLDREPNKSNMHILAPVDDQDVWAAGVTYERSRKARQEEAKDGGDIYGRVYCAERPELFFKSQGKNVVGPYDDVGIRIDATWSVPEPELAVFINPNMEIVGFTIGNDMSSRDIEGANPLYLPQAKIYKGSCALGPGILLQAAIEWPETTISLEILREDKAIYYGDVSTNRIKRKIIELIEYLGRCQYFPSGAILLTGTGIVP